jgi:hypothetical protein
VARAADLHGAASMRERASEPERERARARAREREFMKKYSITSSDTAGVASRVFSTAAPGLRTAVLFMSTYLYVYPGANCSTGLVT